MEAAFLESAFGRERELSLLIREHEEARSRGSARFALVHGPAGVGKSFLMAGLRRELSARGAALFEASVARSGAPKAYALFASVVPDLLRVAQESGVPARVISELAQRLGPLAGRPAVEAEEQGRLAMCDAVAELFSLASRGVPAFAFSDLDVADRASLELLRYLAALAALPGSKARGLYLFTYRSEGALPAPLREVIERLPAVSVPLAGLDVEGIRAFLSRREVAEQLLEVTGGMPTALEEVVGAAAARPADLFERRLRALARPEQDCLLAAAILEQPASAADLAELVGGLRGAVEPLAPLLDKLAHQRLLKIHPALGATAYALATERHRPAILALGSDEDRTRLHAVAGELLERRGAEPEVVARHWLEADPAGRGAAAAIKAAESLADRFAWHEAADLYELALQHVEPAQAPALHVRLSEVLRAAGEYRTAFRHLGLARRGPRASLPELRVRAAHLALAMGRPNTAERLSRAACGATVAEPWGVEAQAILADALYLRGRYAEARELCERGLSAAAPETLAFQLRNTLGKVLLFQSAYPEAIAAFERNASRARELGLRREQAQAIINQGVAAQRQGEQARAVELYRAGIELSAGLDREIAAGALANLGTLYADAGEFEQGIEHLSQALSSFTRAGRSKMVAHYSLNLARLQLFLGELERARELCEHARALARSMGDAHLTASARLVEGEIAEVGGRLSDAAAALGEAREAFEALATPRYAAESALLLARVFLGRGERAAARGELGRGCIEAAARESRALAAEREMVAGELALGAGDLNEAARRASSAKELLLAEPDLEGPCRVYHLLARVRQAAGDPSGAAAELTRAARLLDELAARVPLASRPAFLRVPRRSALLAAAAEREITPARLPRAAEPDLQPSGHALIGRAPALQKIYKVLDAVARSNATVLIRGESGTGKELLADAVHRKSARRHMPLVKVNCAAMVEELLMSELFGHEKGAFTGAVRERKGRFELAEGGTIFLDEIGDISPKAQVALLRVLQQREFERVGGQKTVRVDVRVICATNRDLESMIAQGTFRQDLYYRLKGVMLELPPLRERPEDLPELCSHLLSRFAQERGEELKTLSPEAMNVLKAYAWPGNVRELENVLSSASIFASGRVITPDAFENVGELAELLQNAAAAVDPEEDEAPRAPRALPSSAPGEAVDYYELARRRGMSLRDLQQELETQCILRALGDAKGNISEAARLLGMKRSRLSQIVNSEPVLKAAARS